MNAKMNRVDEMRVYVADLAAYNNGILSGSWINLPSDDIWAEVQKVLDEGTRDRKAANVYDGFPSEEWAIHDYELPWNISEYEDLDMLNEIATKYDDLSEQDQKKLEYLISDGEPIEKAIDNLDSVDIYEDMDYTDLAEMFVDETWDVPEHLQNYIYYDRFARELEYDYADHNASLFRRC